MSIEFIKAKAEKRELFVPVAVPEKIATTTIIDAPASALESALEKLKIGDTDKLFNTVNTIRNGIDQARNYLGVAKQAIEDVLSPADWIVGLVDDVTKLVTFDTNISALSKWRDVVHRVERFENLFQNDDTSPELQRVWRSTLAASQVAIAQQVVATTRTEMANNQEISFTPVDLALVRKKHEKYFSKLSVKNELLIPLKASHKFRSIKTLLPRFRIKSKNSLKHVHPSLKHKYQCLAPCIG